MTTRGGRPSPVAGSSQSPVARYGTTDGMTPNVIDDGCDFEGGIRIVAGLKSGSFAL